MAEDVVRRVRQACGQHLRSNLTGFSRDGKGLKYAPYYDLHFSPGERIRVSAGGVQAHPGDEDAGRM